MAEFENIKNGYSIADWDQSRIVKNHGYTTAIAAAQFVF